MSKTTQTNNIDTEQELVLREVWRAKDTLSAAYGHDLDKLFAEAKAREERSGHPLVNPPRKRKNESAG